MHRLLTALVLALSLACAASAVDLSWTHAYQDDVTTDPFTLSPGLVYLSIFSGGQVTVGIIDSGGTEIETGYLTLVEGNEEASKAIRIPTEGEYRLTISGFQEYTVTLTDPPVDETPGTVWTGVGVQSTGLFPLDAGTVRLALSVQGMAYATLMDEEGTALGSAVHEDDENGPEASREIAIPASGLYLINVAVPSTTEGDWTVSVVAVAGPTPTPGAATYAQARASYIAAAGAWSQAWGASDPVAIRQYLQQARTAYASCLETANGVNDPANGANLALVRSVSTAYAGLADAAIAMYDGADLYGAGRSQINAGTYAAAAGSFGSAAERFASSKTLFSQATTTLQSVSYADTEYGDGTTYTAIIVPLLNAKADYMGEFTAYARGWQHTALAYGASLGGDQATFRSEGTTAMTFFGALRTSPSFGADASANYGVLASLLGTTPTPDPDKKAR